MDAFKDSAGKITVHQINGYTIMYNPQFLTENGRIRVPFSTVPSLQETTTVSEIGVVICQ